MSIVSLSVGYFRRIAVGGGIVTMSCIGSASAMSVGSTFFSNLAENSWTLIETNTPDYEGHSGWAVDSVGGRVFSFGSDTHGDLTPNNSVNIFDANTLQWTESYSPDPLSSYQVDADNYTVTTNGNPWASHVFDNIVYLPQSDSVLVVTGPQHNYTGEAETGGMNGAEVQTWKYDIANNRWEFLKNSGTPISTRGPSGSLWSFGMTYDPVLERAIAVNAFDTFAFDPVTETWELISDGALTDRTGISSESMLVFNTATERTNAFSRLNARTNDRLREFNSDTSEWADVILSGESTADAFGAYVSVDSTRDELVFVTQNQDPGGAPHSTLILDLETNVWTDANPDFTPASLGRGFSMGYLEAFDVTLLHTRNIDTPQRRAGELWAYRGSALQASIVSLPSTLLLMLVAAGWIARRSRAGKAIN